MKVLGYVVIGIGCIACLTIIFILPGAVLIGLGALLIIGSKHVSPAVNTAVAICASFPLVLVIAAGSYVMLLPGVRNALSSEPKPVAAQIPTTKKEKPQQPSRFKECDYAKPGSSVRQICEDQAAAKRKPKVSEN